MQHEAPPPRNDALHRPIPFDAHPDDPLTVPQREFARLLGCLLADQWEREHEQITNPPHIGRCNSEPRR